MSQPLVIDLRRPDTSVPWGFRLEGGIDMGGPLRIVKVVNGSLAEKNGLFAGDVVLSLNGTSAQHLTHEGAKMEIIRSANDVSLTIMRGGVTHINVYSNNQPIVMRGGLPVKQVVSSTRIIPKQSPRPVYRQPNAPTSPRITSTHNNSFNYSPVSFSAPPSQPNPKPYRNVAPPQPLIAQNPTSGRVKKIAHNPYNSPMGLYSNNNIEASLSSAVKVATNPEPSSPPPRPTPNKTLYCASCGEMIKGVFVRVHGESPMHPSCLKCCKCGVGLQNIGYFYIEGALYCETHARQTARQPDSSLTLAPNAVYKR